MNVREKRIRVSGSPYYQISLGVITAGSMEVYDYDSDELKPAKKYSPLDTIEITNDDLVAIEVCLNQRDKFYVPRSTVKEISEHPIHRISVKNLDAATSTTADKIVLALSKSPLTTDKYVRRYKL